MSHFESAQNCYNFCSDNGIPSKEKEAASFIRKQTRSEDISTLVYKRSCSRSRDDEVETTPYKKVVYSGEKYQASVSGFKSTKSQDSGEQASYAIPASQGETNDQANNPRKILKAVRAKDKVASASCKKRQRQDSSLDEGLLPDKKINKSNETNKCHAAPGGSRSNNPNVSRRHSKNSKKQKKTKKQLKARDFFSNIKASINEDAFQSRYRMGEVIGHGAFGTVYEATSLKDGTQVAIKIIPNHRTLSNVKLKKGAMPSEAFFLSKVQHPNIIKLIKCYKFTDSHAIVMEKPRDCKTLLDYVHSQTSQISETDAKGIMRQIVDAVKYLEERGIMHNDLKTENILVDGQGNVKLIDFGLSWRLTDEPIDRGFIGTYSQCPPEYCERREYYGREANVWSLGCILYDMITGNLPFKGHIDAKYRPLRLPEDFPEGAKSLIESMLNKSPVYRATLQEVWNHPWLNE